MVCDIWESLAKPFNVQKDIKISTEMPRFVRNWQLSRFESALGPVDFFTIC